MAVGAEVDRQRDLHGPGDLGPMLQVAGHALAGLDPGQQGGVARVGEFAARVAVVARPHLLAVAVQAGRLQRLTAGEGLAMACLTVDAELVVGVAHLAGHEDRLLGATQQPITQRQPDAGRQQQPQAPDERTSGRTRHTVAP